MVAFLPKCLLHVHPFRILTSAQQTSPAIVLHLMQNHQIWSLAPTRTQLEPIINFQCLFVALYIT